MSFIQVKTGPNKGKVFEVRDNVITIGRDENQTIQILDQGVSRTHAEIFKMGDMCFVRDLNSTNGTFVNGQRITEEVMKATDELLIGTTILVYDDKQPDPVGNTDHPDAGVTATNLPTVAAVKRPVEAQAKPTAHHIGIVIEVDRLLAEAASLEDGLRNAIQRMAETLEADHAYYYAIDAGTRALEIHTAVEPGGSSAGRKTSRTIVNRVLSSGASLLTTDAALDGRFSLSESVVLKKIKSVIAVPVVVHAKTEGLLYFHSAHTERTYTNPDLEVVSLVALNIGKALAHGAPRKNKDLVKRFYEEVWNTGNWSWASDNIAPDAAIASSILGPVSGPDELKTAMKSVTTAFPDFRSTVEELTAEENRVVARLTHTGTHKGKIFGIEPTGRRVSFTGLATFEINAGRISKAWLLSDTSQLLKQLNPQLGAGAKA